MLITNHFKSYFLRIHQLRRKLLVMHEAKVDEKAVTESPRLNAAKMAMAQLNNNSMEYDILPTPVKSENDKKEYRVIKLKNGLTACLIADMTPRDDDDDDDEEEEEEGLEEEEDEDTETSVETSDSDDDDEDDCVPEQKMAAASLTIGVGSFSDPRTVPGMAHFLEHMVFMGSEKFPEENDFDSFISKRGGSDNASTDCEVTTFYFECLEKDLSTALDKFAQFFISPLMKRSSISREREAIDSEFQMALPSDAYRKEQFLLSLARNDSPVNTFTWGNLVTLRDNISEDELYAGVHEFRKRYYSAHRMTLAIQARLPLDELQSYVLQCFSNVPSNDLPPDDFQQFTDVFDTSQFTKLYYLQPVHDVIQVDLTWALPSLLTKYKSKPHDYVSWIIGHEGNGSLLSYLRRKVWVLSVSAGNDESGPEYNSIYALFTVQMILTKEGLEHLFEVIEIVYSYINMLRKVGPQKRLYDEMKTVADTSFKFAAEESAADTVESLSENMQYYTSEYYLTGPELFFEYDPKAINTVLKCLVPQKMNVIVLCNNLPPGLTYDKTETWFGTKYTEQDFPKQWLKKWTKASPLKDCTLPSPNAFLCQDFTLLKEEENLPEYPEEVLKTELVELWYRKDQKFKLPIAYYNFYLINPIVTLTPKAAALLDFYVTLLQILLAEETYPARIADLTYSIRNYDKIDKGLLLSVAGYNEKLHILIELITKHIVNFNSNLTEEMFRAVKDKLIKYYYNSLLKPSSLAKNLRLNILVNKSHSLVDKYNSVSSITFEDLKNFSDNFIRHLYIKILVQGNVTKDHAINVVNNVVTTLKCKSIDPSIYPYFRVRQIPKGETFCILKSFNINDSNSVITNYYQSGPFTIKDSVITDLLMLIIEEPLFDTLRTKEQLGYDVSCSTRDTFGILGFSITVNSQATKNSTEYVETRIKNFITQISELLTTMSKETFETTKNDLIKTKQCADNHLKEEVNRNWTEIADEDYMFDRIKQEIAEIEKLSLDETRQWWEMHTHESDDGDFRKLSIQISGFKNVTDDAKTQKPQDVRETGVKLEINFKDCDSSNTIEDEGPRTQRRCVKDIASFKESLYLHPVVRNVHPVVCECLRTNQT